MNIENAKTLVGDYETGAQQAAQRVANRDVRRKALLKTLDAIAFDALMPADARRGFSARKKALGPELTAALADTALDQAEARIKTLAADVADRDKIIAARGDADIHLTAARDAFAKSGGKLDQGGYTLLETRLRACIAAHGSAASVGDYGAAAQLAKDFLTVSNKAVTYATGYMAWNAKTTTYIANEIPSDVDRKTLRDWRRSLMADAAALVEQEKFTEALARLEEFKTHVLCTVPGKVDEAGLFAAKLLDFQRSHMADFQTVIDAKLSDSAGHKDDYKKAANKGLVSKNYGDAITDINTVVAWYQPRLVCARLMLGLDNKLRKHPAFQNAHKAFNTAYNSADFAKAEKAFDALSPDIGAEGDFHKRVKLLEGRYTTAHALLVDPEKAAIKLEWDTAVSEADTAHKKPPADPARKPGFDSAKAHLDKVEAMLSLGELTELYAPMIPILATHTTADGYGYLKDYRDDRTAGKYADAKAKLLTAVTKMKQLVTYLELKARAEGVKAALPPSAPELIQRIDDALTAAEDHARKSADPAAAGAALTGVLNQTDFESLASDIMDYQALLKRVETRQARVLKLMELAKPKKALTDGLDAARALANPGGDFGAAYAALEAHVLLLNRAQDYASVRRQTIGVVGALERSVNQDPSRDATIFAGAKKLKDVKDDLAKAEIDAANADFDAAAKKYRLLLTECKAMTEECAKLYEASDGADSNAGHSIGRHGPDLTEDELIRRLKTGIAPDGEKSPTGASSKFKSMEDWLASREIGAKRALAEKGVDVEMTKIMPPFDATKEPLPAKFEIDHGKPIDEAFVGVKKAEVLDVNKGEIVEDKNYESFMKMTDLTKSLVNFTWEYDLINGKPWPVDSDGNADRPKDNADYIARYNTEFGVNPAEINGRYVMMQQYPLAEGWDDELKQYAS